MPQKSEARKGWVRDTSECSLCAFHISCIQINLFRGTELIFSGNNASTVGGAIRILNPTVGLDIRGNTVFNTLCFMQYEVELENSTTLIPDEWMVSACNNVRCNKHYKHNQGTLWYVYSYHCM